MSKGKSFFIWTLLVIGILVTGRVQASSATSNCAIIKNDVNITLTLGQTAFIPAQSFIDGYNLTYTVDPDDSYIKLKQIFTQVDSHGNTIDQIVDISYWQETNGGGTYALLQRTEDQKSYRVYIDRVDSIIEAPLFNSTSLMDTFFAGDLETCYGIILISRDQALVDCVSTYQKLHNFFYLVDINKKTFEMPIFNWNYKWGGIKSRNMVKYYGTDIYGNKQLYLFAFTPVTDILFPPNDPDNPVVIPQSYIDVYTVLQEYSQFSGQKSVLIHSNSLDYSDFQLDQLKAKDLVVSGNQIFMVDLDFVYRFQYINDRIQFMYQAEHGNSIFKIAVYQTGYETTVVLALFASLYEWQWTNPQSNPIIMNIYESKLPLNFQNTQSLYVTDRYIAISTAVMTNVYKRGQTDFQDLASGISNTEYFYNQFMLFQNNYGIYCTNDFYKIVHFMPPQIIVTPKFQGFQTYKLTAHSMDHLQQQQSCSVTFNVTSISQESYGIFNSVQMETKNIYLTPFQQYRDDKLSDYFTGPWIQYYVEQNDNYQTVLQVDQVMPTNITFVDGLIDSNDILYQSSFTDDNNGTQFFYTFTQDSSFVLHTYHCGTSRLDQQAGCFEISKIVTLTEKIGSLSFGVVQDDQLIFSISYQGVKSFKTTVDFYTVQGNLYYQFKFPEIQENIITDVDIIGGYVYINQPLGQRIKVVKLQKGFRDVIVIDEAYTADWKGLDGGWNPIRVHGNRLGFPNLIFVETNKALVMVGMVNERAFFVSTIDVVSDISTDYWDRKVAVGSQSLLIAEMNFNTKEQFIKEYDLLDPYDITLTKIQNLYSNTLVYPLKTYYSQRSDIFYIFVNSAQDFSIFLIQMGETTKLNSLYFNYILPDSEQTNGNNLFLSVGGYLADYLTVINQQTNRTEHFYVPHRPTLYVKPIITHKFRSSVQYEKYFLEVSVFDGYEKSLLQRNIIIINPMTDVYTFPTNLTLDTQNETVKSFSVSDRGWVQGTILGYQSATGNVSITNQVTIQRKTTIDLQDSEIILMTYSQKLDVIFALTDDYTLFSMTGADPSQVYQKEVPLAINKTQNPICNYLISIEEYKNESSIVFCQQKDLFYDRWEIFIVDWTSETPQSSPGILLPSLAAFNGEAMFFEGLLYVLNSSEYPNQQRPGRVIVYQLDMSSNFAEIKTQFKENEYGIPYNFDIFAFEVVKTNKDDTAMIVLLESYGHSLYFGTFNYTDPSDFVWSYQMDLQQFLNENFQYLSEDTYLYDIQLIRAEIDPNEFNINNISYTFIITTSDTSIFEVYLQFNTKFVNGSFNLQTAYVTDSFVNYGAAENLFDVQVLGSTFGITYYNVTNNQVILGFYNVFNQGPPVDPTLPTPSTIMAGGLSFKNVKDPQKHDFVLYQCGENKTQVCALSSTGENNNVNIIEIRENITVTISGEIPHNTFDLKLKTISDYSQPEFVTITMIGIIDQPSDDDETDLTALWITLGVLGGIAIVGGIAFWFYQKQMVQQNKLSQLHQPMTGDAQGEEDYQPKKKNEFKQDEKNLEPDINKGSQDLQESAEVSKLD